MQRTALFYAVEERGNPLLHDLRQSNRRDRQERQADQTLMKLITLTLRDLARVMKAGIKIGKKTQRHCGWFDYSVEVQPKTKAQSMLSVSISTEEQVLVTLSPITPRGKPAKLDGKPEWAIISGNVTLAVADDGLSCTIVSGEDPGASEVSVNADADLGEGVEPISDLVEIAVSGVKAASLGLSAAAPTPKP
jgi:hypothetical protein